jgi:hypothetical protein
LRQKRTFNPALRTVERYADSLNQGRGHDLRHSLSINRRAIDGVAVRGRRFKATIGWTACPCQQAKLIANMQVSSAKRSANRALLAGRIFDDHGNRMTPSFSVKKGIRYRYYDCRLLIEGRSAEAGAIQRVSAPDIEKRVLEALAGLNGAGFYDALGGNPQAGHEPVKQLVSRVVVQNGSIRLKLTAEAASTFNRSELDIPWVRPPTRPKSEILLAHTDLLKDGRPIRAEVRSSVVQAVALGRAWLQQLVSGEVTDTEAIARREDLSKRSVHMMISLAFVAPDIIEALIVGRLPRGFGITR